MASFYFLLGIIALVNFGSLLPLLPLWLAVCVTHYYHRKIMFTSFCYLIPVLWLLFKNKKNSHES